jgi:hypothetical protein
VIILSVAVASLALAGTGIQAYQSLRNLKDVDPEGHRAFVTIDDLKIEHRFMRHPILWCRRTREMQALLRESPEETRLYRRVWLQLWGWLLLAGASILGLVAALAT